MRSTTCDRCKQNIQQQNEQVARMAAAAAEQKKREAVLRASPQWVELRAAQKYADQQVEVMRKRCDQAIDRACALTERIGALEDHLLAEMKRAWDKGR